MRGCRQEAAGARPVSIPSPEQAEPLSVPAN
jgi:hypothetical protein